MSGSFDRRRKTDATMDAHRYAVIANELRSATLALLFARFMGAANRALTQAAERMNRRSAAY